MSYYDKVIAHVEQKLGAVTTRRFTNVGHWMFCPAEKFSPFLVVAFGFNDDYGTFSYYAGKGLDLNQGYVNGCGCMPGGCVRQEHWRLPDLDQALTNLTAYVGLAKQGCALPMGDVYNLRKTA
jgi:hypothetical protein